MVYGRVIYINDIYEINLVVICRCLFEVRNFEII